MSLWSSSVPLPASLAGAVTRTSDSLLPRVQTRLVMERCQSGRWMFMSNTAYDDTSRQYSIAALTMAVASGGWARSGGATRNSSTVIRKEVVVLDMPVSVDWPLHSVCGDCNHLNATGEARLPKTGCSPQRRNERKGAWRWN